MNRSTYDAILQRVNLECHLPKQLDPKQLALARSVLNEIIPAKQWAVRSIDEKDVRPIQKDLLINLLEMIKTCPFDQALQFVIKFKKSHRAGELMQFAG